MIKFNSVINLRIDLPYSHAKCNEYIFSQYSDTRHGWIWRTTSAAGNSNRNWDIYTNKIDFHADMNDKLTPVSVIQIYLLPPVYQSKCRMLLLTN